MTSSRRTDTKGIKTAELRDEDHAAERWCEAARALTGKPWKYVRVNDGDFHSLGPSRLSDLQGLFGL